MRKPASHPLSSYGLLLSTLLLSACASFSPTTEVPLTDSEKAARAEEIFAVMDTDGDGFLTKDEMTGGLRYLTTADTPATRDLMYGLKKKTSKDSSKRTRPIKRMSEEEVRQLVEESFKTPDQIAIDRISKEDFRKIVVERRPSTQDTPSPTWDNLL